MSAATQAVGHRLPGRSLRSAKKTFLVSGTLFYDYVTCNMYAIVYTALPILLYGTYDRDISAETCLRYTSRCACGVLSFRSTRQLPFRSIEAEIITLLRFEWLLSITPTRNMRRIVWLFNNFVLTWVCTLPPSRVDVRPNYCLRTRK